MNCGRKIGPYDCCSVVCGDCLELMKALPDGCVDAVITDPPYGINWNCDYAGWVKDSPNAQGGDSRRSYPKVFGDDKPFDPTPFLGFKTVILWGAPCFLDRLGAGTLLVWWKRESAFLAQAEAGWMNRGTGVYVYKEPVEVMQQFRSHPTQKPVGLMEWAIDKAGMPETILDPFLGSGTTAVAAKKLGRHFLGFEISEEYCRIARERIALVEAQPNLFEPKPMVTKELFDEWMGKET